MQDVLHALKYCFKFYNKELDKHQIQVWQHIIRNNNYSSYQWTEVLKNYFQVGKFAPKPPEILEMLTELAERKRSRQPQAEPITTNCPEQISSAWRHWIPIFWGQSLPFSSDDSEVTPEQEEEWLVTVNREAKRTDSPESIPLEYRIEEIWCAQRGAKPRVNSEQPTGEVHDRRGAPTTTDTTQGHLRSYQVGLSA